MSTSPQVADSAPAWMNQLTLPLKANRGRRQHNNVNNTRVGGSVWRTATMLELYEAFLGAKVTPSVWLKE